MGIGEASFLTAWKGIPPARPDTIRIHAANANPGVMGGSLQWETNQNQDSQGVRLHFVYSAGLMQPAATVFGDLSLAVTLSSETGNRQEKTKAGRREEEVDIPGSIRPSGFMHSCIHAFIVKVKPTQDLLDSSLIPFSATDRPILNPWPVRSVADTPFFSLLPFLSLSRILLFPPTFRHRNRKINHRALQDRDQGPFFFLQRVSFCPLWNMEQACRRRSQSTPILDR